MKRVRMTEEGASPPHTFRRTEMGFEVTMRNGDLQEGDSVG